MGWNEEEYQAVINDVVGLPAKKVLPYCLWFNFLQIACKDPETKVNRRHYREWGSYENIDFIKWWPSHAHLFKVDVGVRHCDRKSLILSPDSEIILRVPLYQSKKQSLNEISQILDDCGAGNRLADMRQGKFPLSVGVAPDGRAVHPATRFLRNLGKIRLYQWIYLFWLRYHGLHERERLERTATLYRDLAQLLRQRDSLPLDWHFELPNAFTAYADYLTARGKRERLPMHEANGTDIANSRRQVARYIRKARRIAANVGRGSFPGDYERD